MKTKLCRKCNLEKNIDNFRLKKDKCGKYYIYSYCKQCEKEFFNIKRKTYDKNYRNKHKEEINKRAREKNKQKELTLYEKEKRRNNYRIYVKQNKERLKQARNEYERERKQNDKTYKLKCQIRHCIRVSFLKKGLNKSSKTESILGINLAECYKYLLQTYKNNYGYEWDGKEKIHIDHIIPLTIAETEEETIKLCHYTNLQLLKADDNLKKGTKTNFKLQ